MYNFQTPTSSKPTKCFQLEKQRYAGLSVSVDLLGLTEGMTMTELAEPTDLGEKIEPMTVDSIDQRELAEQLLE